MILIGVSILAFCCSTFAAVWLIGKGRRLATIAAFLVNMAIMGAAGAFLYKYDPVTHHKASGSMGIVSYLAMIPLITWLNLLFLEYKAKK